MPCYQRAAAVTAAGETNETLLDGDAGEEQWVVADGVGPLGGARTRKSAGEDDDIPTLGEEEAAAQPMARRAWILGLAARPVKLSCVPLRASCIV